jgi:hypothetical protein
LPDSVFGGLVPGTCGEACQENEQICVTNYDSPETPLGPSGLPTPLYYTCNNGQWELDTCPNGNICRSYTQQDPAEDGFMERRIICGGDCTPFTSQCGGAGMKQIADCSADGTLGDFRNCSYGACATDAGRDGGTSGFCEAECVPGEKTCTDALTEATCSNNGRFGTGQACEGLDTCAGFDVDRLNGTNLSRFGCAECLPVNQTGQPDMRCSTDNVDELELCGADGTYAGGETATCTACATASVGAGSSAVSCGQQ